MRLVLCAAALLVGAAAAQPLCSTDGQGNQVCATTQASQSVCGCLDMFGGCHFFPVYCNDVVVKKTAPNGQAVYMKILGGESDQEPRQIFFDPQGNLVLFGTTYSKQFPVTPGASQPNFAGPPAPNSTTGSLPPPGGDLFLSILSPAGDLLYSTFLGSSGNDTIGGIQAVNEQVEVLVNAGSGNFLGAATQSGGPVLLTFDLNTRSLVRSVYLPIATPLGYAAALQKDGTATVTTAGGLYTFGPDGQQRSMVSLEAFAFAAVPQTAPDPAGDLWLVGPNASRQVVVAKLGAGAFTWTLPAADDGYSTPYLSAPLFGSDGLAYFGGSNATLLSTTPNALLETPCFGSSAGVVAVLDGTGQVRMLSYLPGLFTGVAAIDLSQRPKVACVSDVLDRVTAPPPTFGVGEVVRLRGGGFGPDASLSVQVAGVAAPVLSAAAGEVVFAIPFETADGDAVPVTVQYGGQQSAPFPIAVRAAAPWLVEPIFNGDGTPNRFITPANWGSVVTLFVTGAGPYTPGASPRLQLPVSISFLGTSQLGTILYAGPAPGWTGLAQINVQLPPSGTFSSLTPVLTIGTVSAYLPSIWMQ